MSISSELALETAVRAFGDGSVFTLENGALVVGVFNVIAHSLVLIGLLLAAASGLSDGVVCYSGPSPCLRVTPQEAMAMGIIGTLFSGSMIYLNVRLYSAVQEKDEEFVYLWLKITAVIALVKTAGYPHVGYLVPDILELWLVYAYQQSQEMRKLKTNLPVVLKS